MRKKCFLIGEKLGHSYSAEIHRCWADYTYELRPLAPDAVIPFLHSGAFDGLNVTIPYKETVMPFCATIAPEAQKIGSVNTILRDADGKLHGFNTDYAGFAGMAAKAGITFAGRKVLIFGSGGTSKTARAVAADAGAREVIVISRKGPVDYSQLPQHQDGEILINTTPVGMYPETAAMPFDPRDFPDCCGVLDVIYNPARTRLLQRAQELHLPWANGLWMLVEQARVAGGYFSGMPLPDFWTEKVWNDLNRAKLNCVLIGMPGSGKSTVGKLLGQRLQREVVDLDEWITKRAGMPPAAIFAQFGEAKFREMEHHAAAEIGREGKRVIVTGGGTVLDRENVRNLAQNGRIFYLRRALEHLACGHGRPLSANRAAVAKLAEQRLPLYEAACDTALDVQEGAPEATADRIAALW